MPTNSTHYSVGDDVTLSVVVKSTGGVATNTGMTLIVQSPSTAAKYGPITSTASTTLDNTTVGTWRKVIAASRAGRWTYYWKSTGTVNVSTNGAFAVLAKQATT